MECTGCKNGVVMCYNRPCLGTPEEFEKIIDAGFARKLRIDFWAGRTDITDENIEKCPDNNIKQILIDMKEYQDENPNPFSEDVEMLSGGTPNDNNYKASWNPSGKCNLLDENNLCVLHNLNLKPEQGRESCCKKEIDEAKDNLYYAKLWSTEKGKEVINKFKNTIINL